MAETETVPVTPETAPVTTAPTVDWAAHVPKEYEATFKPYEGKPLAEVFKGYGEAAKLIGARPQGVKIPDEKSTPEERQAFETAVRKAQGVPESPDKYTIKPHPLMAHKNWSHDAQTKALQLMHAKGVPNETAQGLIHFYADLELEQIKAREAERQQALADLRAEWGANFGPYMGGAQRAVENVASEIKVDPAELLNAISDSNGAMSPVLVKTFHWIQTQLLEHGMETGRPASLGMDPMEAQQRDTELRDELRKLPDSHPRRQRILDEIIRITPAMARR